MLKDKIRRKLKSEQGTSIFFGLLLFLVASILSAVILEGAVTTVKTVASDRDAEQNYLTCSSAAQVLRDYITGITLSAKVTERTSRTDNSSLNLEKKWNEPTVKDNIPAKFASLLWGYIKTADEQNVAATNSSIKKKLTISTKAYGTVEGLQQFEKLDPVNVELTIIPVKADASEVIAKRNEVSYNITAKLSTGSGKDCCQLTLSLTGRVEAGTPTTASEDSDSITTETSYKYTWQEKDIFYGSEERELKES